MSELDDLDELTAPEASAYDGPPADVEPVDDLDEPASTGRVLPFGRPRRARKPKPVKLASSSTAPELPKGKARDALTADLAAGVAALGIAVGLGLPTTGYVVADRSEGIAAATVKLAETNEAVRRALLATNTGMTYLDLGTHTGAILVAVMVDRGLLDPYSFPSSGLKVTGAWEATHPELLDGAPASSSPAPDWRSAPPVPAFVG